MYQKWLIKAQRLKVVMPGRVKSTSFEPSSNSNRGSSNVGVDV